MNKIWQVKSLREAATRPEFYQFLQVALKDLLFKAYKEAKVSYPQIVTFGDSDKAKEGYPSLGNMGLPVKVLEGEPYSERQPAHQDFVEVTNFKFGEIMAITRELIEDDQTKMIARMPNDLGNAHAKQEDASVYSIMINNPTIYDSSSYFSLNHPGYTGGAAIGANDNIYTNVTLSANALAVVLGIIAGWRGHTDQDILDVTATDVVVPKGLLQTAKMLTQSGLIPLAYAAGNLGPAGSIGAAPNPIKDYNLGVISSARLDQASAPLDWYVKTDFPGLMFQWREKLAFLQENEASGTFFERDVYRWKTRARWGLKVINWRNMLKVS